MKATKASALLAALLTFTVPVATAADAWAKPKPKGALSQILVVDDAATVRQQVGIALNGQGYTMTEAFDGQDGLEKASKASFSVIVTDESMPVMGGLTMVKTLRAAGVKTPILMMSTTSCAALTAALKAAGANGCLPKPFDPNQLVTIV
jgi:two-component system chemotaxis response regulator CheY